MCKLRTLALTCFFIVCIFKGLFSQITISNTNGCLPNGITNAIFTYAGTGTPTGISWNFGDGSPTSNQNPTQHSYPNLGTYTVTFSAIVGGNPVTATATVVVNPQPTGAFTPTLPASHCAGMIVNFSGTSPMSNVIYKWDFGDGNISQGNPVSHAYTSQGTFNPILTIQNTLTGCFVNVPGTGINVSLLPNVSVNVSPAASTCSTSLNASFNGSGSSSGSPLGGGLTYAWNFGSFGSGTGAVAGPILFQPQGTYGASLTVTDNNSCSNTTVIPISLMSPTVSASLLPTVCINSQGEPYVDITVQSNMPSISLDLDNGGGVLGFPLPIPPNPIPPILSPNTPYTGSVVAYTTPGLKTLTFTAVSGTCITSITRTVMVEKITPTFVPVSADYTCSPSFSLAYLNQSTLNTANVLSYTWTVKHWTEPAGEYTSTAVNPTIIASQISANPYVIPGPYHPNVTLLARSAIGCSATIVQTFDTIWRPTAFFHKSVREGCAPLTVTLTDHSYFDNLINPVSGAPLNPITSYTWNAGDGVNVVVGTGSNVIAQPFTYTSSGTYTPFLVIQTAMGCTDVSFIDTITVSNPPTISYTLPSSPVCAGQQVTVNLAASPSSSTSIWHVESDAGYFSGCISNNAAVGAFNHVGIHGFTLSVSQRGCATTSVIPQTITVNGPVARFRFQTQCTGNKKSVDFSCYVNDATGATIDFGDQSSTAISCMAGAVTSTLVAHTYSAAGDYTAIITAINSNGCPSYMYSRVIKIREITPSFTISDTIVCKSDGTFTVDASASQGHLVTQGAGYTWIFDDDAVV
ncbi:MAG: PKD domain-containing protein, partial [Bacteroidia bacterium]|nr:PKD domain-containing protein [Bacteroidia bacterium]